MGARPHAILGYGFDLGGPATEWKVQQAGEYGELNLDWFDEDEDEADFVEAAQKRLLAAVGFTKPTGYLDREDEVETRLGVKFERYISDDQPQYVLAARVISVDWDDDAKLIDLAELQREPAAGGWDTKLQFALNALGLTPKQEQPGWLLVPYEG